MSDDEDAPENLPLYKRLWKKMQASMGFSVFCTVLLISLVALWIIGHYYDQTWSAEQWGPVAAWFSGAATFFAVAAALYQAKLARDDAEQTRKDRDDQALKDEARHAKDLEDANRRLTHELNANRRLEQLKTIPPIWEAIPRLTIPTDSIIAFMKRHNEDTVERATIGRKQSESTSMDYKRLNENWLVDYERVAAAFTPAEILIDDEPLARVVATCHHRLQTLQEHLVQSMKVFARDELLDHARVRELTALINDTKTPMLLLARSRLSDITSPIMAFPEHAPPEHMLIVPPIERPTQGT